MLLGTGCRGKMLVAHNLSVRGREEVALTFLGACYLFTPRILGFRFSNGLPSTPDAASPLG